MPQNDPIAGVWNEGRDKKQRVMTAEQWYANRGVTCVCGHTGIHHDPEDGNCEVGPPCEKKCIRFEPGPSLPSEETPNFQQRISEGGEPLGGNCERLKHNGSAHASKGNNIDPSQPLRNDAALLEEIEQETVCIEVEENQERQNTKVRSGVASPAERPQSPDVMGIEGVNWGKDTAKYFPSAASGSKPGPRCREFVSLLWKTASQWDLDEVSDREQMITMLEAFFTPSAGEPPTPAKEKA